MSENFFRYSVGFEKQHFRETQTQPPITLTLVEIAWLAGLLEGEGTFGIDTRSVKRYKNSTAPPSPFITVSMTDKDIMERVSEMTNKKLLVLTLPTKRKKRVYKVHIGDRATVAYLLEELYPFMGERRRTEIQLGLQSLQNWRDWLSAKQEVAKKK